MTAEQNRRSVLVTGGTGRQGGAAARALLAQGTPVRALVRDLHSQGAEALKALGATLVLGDLDDRESLLAACTGAYAVFSVQTPNLKDLASDSERVHGRNLVEVAKAAHVTHFIHTSVSGTGDHHRSAPGWKEGRWKGWNERYWETKAATEELVRSAGFPFWTLLKPSFFMENFVRPSFLFANFVDDRLLTALAPDKKVACVTVQDVGTACAAAINAPEKFNKVELELAGELLTMREAAAILSEVWGKRIEAPDLSPTEAIAQGLMPEFVRGQEWMNEVGSPATPEQAQALGVPTTDFKTWARQKWPAPA
ncbi:NmrA family NAD(P)-binding protein [Hyalangium versicolor]|uniref:NmrA family NAD(P)-binding protein n=1 Tax=Hyalangium versicolor TaxID=2861190 RepID=UPI001CCA119D|nr:NmrA family NAD(P)-binding protein [Hyalangium versicolor]